MTMLGVILYIMTSKGDLLLHDNYRTMDQCIRVRETVLVEMKPRRRDITMICVPHYDFSEAQG